ISATPALGRLRRIRYTASASASRPSCPIVRLPPKFPRRQRELHRSHLNYPSRSRARAPYSEVYELVHRMFAEPQRMYLVSPTVPAGGRPRGPPLIDPLHRL